MEKNDFLQSDLKKFKILEVLSDEKWYSYHRLHRELGMNYDTTKRQLNFLEILGFVKILQIKKEDSASEKAHYSVKITDKGKSFLSKMK